MPINFAVVSLGSNIQPKHNIRLAREILGCQFPIIRESRFVRTRPIGIKNQPDFINGAVLLKTTLTRQTLKARLKKIEDTLGRKNEGQQFGPRTIDLDIIVWNSRIIDPDFYQRNFLKAAVLEVLPDLGVK